MVANFSRRQTHDLTILPNVERKSQASVFINDLFDCLFECHFGPFLQRQSENVFRGSFHSSPIARHQRLVILFIYYTKLVRLLQSDYDRVLPELSNRYQESARGRYSARKFLIERLNRRRITASGTSCPPFNTRS